MSVPTEHRQATSAILVSILVAPFHAKPAAALSATAAGQPKGPIVEEGLLGGDARQRRHSKSGYIVQAEPGANLKTNKASSHAAGASCHSPHPVRAPCHQKLPYGAHATSNTKHTLIRMSAQLALTHAVPLL